MDLYVFSSSLYGQPILRALLEAARGHDVRIRWVRLAGTPRHRWTGAARALVDQAKLWRFGFHHRVMVIPERGPVRLPPIPPGSHGIIAGFSKILPPDVIASFTSLVNVHPSLLPYYRGPVPSTWAIREGEAHSGFTIHRVSDRIDAGEILFQEVVPVLPGDTPDALDLRIAAAAAKVIPTWVQHLASGAPWAIEKVDADRWVKHRVGYRSFPKATE